jgi:hypothetical protein
MENMIKLHINKKNAIRSVGLSLLLFIFALLNLSCNGNKPKNTQNHFKVIIDIIAYQNGNIQVFYTKIAEDAYLEALSIRKVVRSSAKLQSLIFEIPYGTRVKNVRIDLGETANIGDSLRIENIRFEYKDRVVDGKNGLYKSWFTFNENVSKGSDSLTFRLKKVDGYFDPKLNGNRKLNAKLVKLFPPDINETGE